jgi:small subunit ribosomal protein S4
MDSVVFRLGFAATRSEARQLVLHGHVHVNGRRLNIPSALVRVGDKVSILEKSREIPRIKESVEGAERRGQNTWFELDKATYTGTIKTLPVREEITLDIKEQLIVEFYSR